MREIKFRAWFSGSMHDEFVIIDPKFSLEEDDLGCPLNAGIADFLKHDDPSSPCVLMQFTGLKDKNGRDIYEGDVLGRDYWCEGYENDPLYWPRKDRIEVKADQATEDGEGYYHYGWNITPEMLKDTPAMDLSYYKARSQDGYKVIGNIYENPELV